MCIRQLSFTAILLFMFSVGVLTTSTSASVVLELSTHSSEDPFIPPEDLSATFDFEVTGNELTLTVTNHTSEFNLRRIFFNADSTVSDLSLTSNDVGNWLLTSNPNQEPGVNTQAGGFGIYSFGVRTILDPILPGETGTFTFDITGSGFSAMSFANTLSNDPDGTHLRGFAAGQFVQGPNDASAFGAIVPAPGSAALLLMALIAGVTGRRRRPAS